MDAGECRLRSLGTATLNVVVMEGKVVFRRTVRYVMCIEEYKKLVTGVGRRVFVTFGAH